MAETIVVTVSGPAMSGKSSVLSVIKDALDMHDIEVTFDDHSEAMDTLKAVSDPEERKELFADKKPRVVLKSEQTDRPDKLNIE